VSSKIHFHTFDAFRFFAFFKVFIFHIPFVFIRDSEPLKAWYSDHIRHGGGVGVSFFFVLSGFLITYILTHEKIQTDTVNLKRFFLRRAFRIWPLFYFLVLIALFIPPNFAESSGFYMNGGGYVPDWRFSLTFTENYKSILMDGGPRTTPLSVFWSLCIEEHFYLIWMIVFFFLKRKFIPIFLILSVVLAWVFRAFHGDIYHTENVVNNDLFTNLDYFAISGLLGYFVALNYDKVSEFVLKIPIFFRMLYIGLVVVILLFQKAIFAHHTWFLAVFQYTIYALMFTGLLLIFIPQKGQLRISNNSVFARLGRISYGLYVYHIIWIHVMYKIYLDHRIELNNWSHYLLFTSIVFAATVLTSYLSYRFFEMPILRLREKWFPST
jgi:peptidoglycan/LPS O-acetylase OafA/YrhL